MDLWINLVLPLIGLLLVTLAAAFVTQRRTSSIHKAAMVGGCVVPIVFLMDMIYWFGWDMAVDGPPPGMILLSLPITLFVLWVLFYGISYSVLRITSLIK